MAVLHGARLRHGALPAPAAPGTRPRVAVPRSGQPAHRVRPTGLLLAGIAAATILGLAYLTQTLGSNATNSEIRSLDRARGALQTEINRHAILVLKAADGDTVRSEARRLGLKKLGDPVVLTAP